MTFCSIENRSELLGQPDPREEHLATLSRSFMRDDEPYAVWHQMSPQAPALLMEDDGFNPWMLRKCIRDRPNGSQIYRAMGRFKSRFNVEGIHLFDPKYVPSKDDPMYLRNSYDRRLQTKTEIVNRVKQEVDILSKLEHKNVVKYYGMDMGENDIFVFFDSPTTRTAVCQTEPMEEFRVSILTRDILNGLACLHSNNLAHRELNSGNIFIQKDGSAKIGYISWIKNVCFSSQLLSRIEREHDILSYYIFEPEWCLAPEVLHKMYDRGPEADIWNLGTTLLEMLTGDVHSWPKYNGEKSIEELLNTPGHISDTTRDFIRRCLEFDPSKRPSAKELLNHPFVSWLEHRTSSSSLSPEIIQSGGSEGIQVSEEEF